MNTPIRAKAESHHRPARDIETGRTIVWPLLECLVGGIGAGIVFLLSFPILADIMSPLGALSPTGLLFVFLFVWLFLWLLTALSREWVMG
jgi:hypothetical protein